MKDKMYKLSPDLLFYILFLVSMHEPGYYNRENLMCIPLDLHDDILDIKEGYMGFSE